MSPFGYHPVQHTPGLWFHDNRHTMFILVAYNFCVQYPSTEDDNHFLNALRAKYTITVDMESTFYIGIKLGWDYVHRTFTLSIPSYVSKALHIFQHIMRGGKDYYPHNCDPIQYGKRVQYAEHLDAAEYLSEKDRKLPQRKSLMLTTSQHWSKTKGGSTCASIRHVCSQTSRYHR